MAKKTVSKPKSKPKTRRTRLLALEPRMLFDGALGIDIAAQASAPAPHADAHADAHADTAEAGIRGAVPQETKEAVPAGKQADAGLKPGAERLDARAPVGERNEIVFIDTSVQGYQSLLSDVNPNARVVLLDGSRDGVKQIADFLSHESNVDAIHIVSHGSEGMLQIGSAQMDVLSMARTYANDLSEIGKHLSQNADILVYGCDFGHGSMGSAATTELSWLTGADVASSVDLTGDAALKGNWALERDVGAIESSVAFGERAQQAFHGVLATLDFDKSAWTPGNLTGSYAVGSGNVTITLSGNTARLAAGNPAEGTAFTGNMVPVETALQVQSSGFASNAEYIDITIAFSQPGGVSKVSFNMFDIDTGAYTDKITVTGTNSSGAINPTSIASDPRAGGAQTWVASGGNTITANAAAANTGAGAERGTAVVRFDQDGITQVTIRFQNTTGLMTAQAIALHDISFDQAPAA